MLGVKILETYKLNPGKLTEIMSVLHASKTDAFLGEDGTIGICGTVEQKGVRTHADIGRLVEGSHIEKKPQTLYLQTFETEGYECCESKPNLVDLFREYIV
jgi:hypothetical protein